jgi:hypothetical protein
LAESFEAGCAAGGGDRRKVSYTRDLLRPLRLATDSHAATITKTITESASHFGILILDFGLSEQQQTNQVRYLFCICFFRQSEIGNLKSKII